MHQEHDEEANLTPQDLKRVIKIAVKGYLMFSLRWRARDALVSSTESRTRSRCTLQSRNSRGFHSDWSCGWLLRLRLWNGLLENDMRSSLLLQKDRKNSKYQIE